jgi:hypothetical protein
MLFDTRLYDAEIILTGTRSRGVWAYQYASSISRNSIRAAGRLNRDASTHTLLAAGLITALRGITKGQANRLVGTSTGSSTRKPRLSIRVTDATFAQALQRQTTSVQPKLRAGRQFVFELNRQLSRFNCAFTTEAQTVQIQSIAQWGSRFVSDPRNPPVFTPEIVMSHQ